MHIITLVVMSQLINDELYLNVELIKKLLAGIRENLPIWNTLNGMQS